MRITLSPAATLFHEDCREALRQMPSDSLDSCVTDPPYALVSVVKRFGGANAAPAKGNDAYMRASAARFFYSAKASKADRAGSKHPTVKPIALMQWLARLITPPGGVILDPFAGSGTTGIAAVRKGFQVVLCEREAEYVADIKARFAPALPRRLVPNLASEHAAAALLSELQVRLALRVAA